MSFWKSKPAPYASITGISERRPKKARAAPATNGSAEPLPSVPTPYGSITGAREKPKKISAQNPAGVATYTDPETGQSRIDIRLTFCDACNKEDVLVLFKKCSICKQKYYCSAECQQKDWGGTDGHKMYCSPEPEDMIPKLPKIDAVLNDILKRVRTALGDVVQAWKRAGIDNTQVAKLWKDRSAVPEMQKLIDIEYPDRYKYEVATSLRKLLPPWRLATVRAARVIIIHDLARYPPDARVRLSELWASKMGAIGGVNSHRFDVNKYFAVPFSLSPGEYEILIDALPSFYQVLPFLIPHTEPRGSRMSAETVENFEAIKVVYAGLRKAQSKVPHENLAELFPEASTIYEAKHVDLMESAGILTPGAGGTQDWMSRIAMPGEEGRAARRKVMAAMAAFDGMEMGAKTEEEREKVRQLKALALALDNIS